MINKLQLPKGPIRGLLLSRSGFTLIELLVVIAIIAILAGVAFGPITGGIKKAQENAAVQSTHIIALAEFEFANDNNENYPDVSQSASNNGIGATSDASAICQQLLAGNYVEDAKIFIISSAGQTKYTGVSSNPAGFARANSSYDFMGTTTHVGVNSNTPDTTPLVWSTVGSALSTTAFIATGPVDATLSGSSAFGTDGVAMCYKSNSALWLKASVGGTSQVEMVDQSYPGWPLAQVLPGGSAQ